MTAPARRPLHLLEVELNWPPETFLQWKLAALVAAGLRVTVATRGPRDDGEFRLPGVEVERLPPWDETRPRRLLGALRGSTTLAVKDARRLGPVLNGVRHPPVVPRRTGWWGTIGRLRTSLLLAGLRPDVVHFEWESAAVHWLPLFDVWDCPVVVSCHGGGLNVHPHTGEHDHVVKDYETVFRRAAAIHVVSETLAREAATYGADPERTWLIRPAVDPDYFKPDPRTDGGGTCFRVIAVGELNWGKGYDYALQAVRAIVDAGVPVQLEILGGEPPVWGSMPNDRARILWTIHDLGLDGCVRLRGEVPSIEVCRLLQSADVLLHASVNEGIPVAVLEAMACGLPVVVTDAGGTREAVRDGVEGFVIPPREPRKLAHALTALWRDPDLRTRMGRAGRARTCSSFALDEQTRRYVELYEAVAGAPRGVGR